MGIPGLWDLIADCKEIVSLAELATKHFEQHKRPLRIAVDEATWRHKLYISNKGKLCKKYSTIHLNERNLITFVLRLLKLNIQLIFVADGPQKPHEKYKGKGAGVWKFKNNVLQECLRLLGVKWHDAPGEAEAECAVLQRRGVVDCVWTEDGDALMFGCGVLVRFCYGGEEGEEEKEGENEKEKGKGKAKGGGVWTAKRGGMKGMDRVVLYRVDVIQAKHPGFDREGLVLFVLLSGGDYGKGLQDCGVGRSSKVVEMGFGRGLYRAMETPADLEAWRNNLRKYFIGSKTGVSVPGNFPDKRIWGLYNSPVISSVERLEKLEENVWSGKIDEQKLQAFFVEKFNWGIDKYIDYVISILLTQSLASFDRNGQSNMDEYNLTYMESGLKCNVWYSLFAVTSLGKEWVDKCIEGVNKKRANNWKRYELPWGTEPTVEGRDLLTCIVKNAMEPEAHPVLDVEPEVEQEPEQSIVKSRRRPLSSQRYVLEDRTRVKKSRISISPPPKPTPHDRFAVTKEEISFDIPMCEELDEDFLDEPLGTKPKALGPSHSSSPSIILDEQEAQQGHDASVEMALESIKSLESSRNACRRIGPTAHTNSKSRSTQHTPTNLLSELKPNSVSKSTAHLPHSYQFATTNEEYINTYHIAMDEPLDSDSECEILNTSFSKSRTSNPPPTNHKSSHPNSHSHTTSTSTSHLHRTPNTTNPLPMHTLPPNQIPPEFKHQFEFENDYLIAMDEPLDFDLDLDSETESLDAKFSISSISKLSFEHGQLVSNPHFITHSSFPLDLEMGSDDIGRIVSAPCVHGHGHDGDKVADEDEDDVMDTKEDISFDIDIDIDIATDEELEQELNLDNEPQYSPSSLNKLNSTNSKILQNISAHNPNTSPPTLGTTLPNPNPNPNPHRNQSAPAPAPANPNPNPNPNPNILLYPSHPTGPYQELDISTFFSDFSSQPLSSPQPQAQNISRPESKSESIKSIPPLHPNPQSNLQSINHTIKSRS
ncbi:hypothetical protein OCU04_010681 [Sclerotinia nivalis]|uniref:XPG-I domain-containing protein n=1 Tax=Sclerotinia nivalis TaxID=352851 RepID=A0A9X0DEY8_9HELO|nr:hypothetical protein OCU04_010681 [Sclerotinia nivalis]